MKRIKVENNNNQISLENKILDKYKDDSFFAELYCEYQVKLNNVDLFKLLDVVESRRKCLDCDGLDSCKQTTKYHYLDFNETTVFHKPCQYQIERGKLAKKHENLIYTTFSLNHELPKISDLHKGKNRTQVYEYLTLLKNNEVKQGLFLCGAPGVGKTFIVEVLLNMYLEENKKCAYILLNDFFNEMRALFYSYDREDRELFNRLITRLKNVSVLIIDDIGAERVDEVMRDDVLFPILDYRMNNDKLTHFTSNYDFARLERHYANTSSKVSEPIKAKRIMERISILSREFILDDTKSKR